MPLTFQEADEFLRSVGATPSTSPNSEIDDFLSSIEQPRGTFELPQDVVNQIGREMEQQAMRPLQQQEDPAMQAASRIASAGTQAPELLEELARSEGPDFRGRVKKHLAELLTHKQPDSERAFPIRMAQSAARGIAAIPRGIDQTLETTLGAAAGINELSSEQQQFIEQGQAAKEAKDSPVSPNDPFYARWTLQAAEMAPKMVAGVGVAAVTGGGALAAGGAAGTFWFTQIFPDRYKQFKDDGLSNETAMTAAAISSAIEGGIETLQLNPFKSVTKDFIGKTVKERMLALAKRYGKELGEEYLQSVVSESVEQIAGRAEGNSPRDIIDSLANVADDTLRAAGPLAVMMGVPGAVEVARSQGVKEFAQANPEAAAVLASKERPSRSDFEKAGLGGLEVNAEQRAEVAQQLRETLSPQEPAEIEPPEARANMARPAEEVEPVKAAEEPAEPVVPADEPASATIDLPESAPPEQGFDPKTTSARKAQMAQDRKRLHLDELPEAESIGWQKNLDNARTQRIPERAMRIAGEIMEKPRALNADETAGLAIKVADLKDEHEAITAKIGATADPADIKTLSAESLRIEQEFDILSQAIKASGTEKGRALAAQKLTIDQDYRLVSVLSRAKAKKGAELKSSEREWFENTIKQLTEINAKLQQGQATPAVKKPSASERLVLRLEAEAEKSKIALKAMSGKLYSNPVDPEPVIHLAKIAAAKIARGGYEFARFTADMVAEFSERIKPFLDRAWERANQVVGSETILDRIRDKSTSGKDFSHDIQKLVRHLVSQGIEEREPLIDAVHKELQSVVPDITRDQAMDAISRYGEYKQLSKDQVSVKIRDLKGQMQQLGKLRDLEAKLPPKKTGVERRDPSAEERQLIKQVNDLRKELGIEATDPATQLKSTLEAIKTRLRNEIEELELQISKGEKADRTRSSVTYDAEAKALKAQRDAKKAEFDEIFGKPELTTEQRIQRAGKALDRSIGKLQEQLDAGELYPTRKGVKVSSPALEAKRAKLAGLKKQRDMMRFDDTETRIRNREESLRESIEELQERLDHPYQKVKKTNPSSKETERLEFQRDKLQRQIRQKIQSLKPKSLWQKTAIEPFNAVRTLMTTGEFSVVLRQGLPLVLSRPVTAAQALRPMFHALASEQYAAQTMKDLIDPAKRPNAPFYLRTKLIADREEVFESSLVQKIPYVGAIVNRFSDAASVFLNKLRADAFDAMAATLARNGEPDAAEMNVIANAVKVFTGRGELGRAAAAVQELNATFFAPRYVVSRFQMFMGQPLWKGTAATRKLIAAEYARIIVGAGIVMIMGALVGGEIEKDPRSSDFGKIRFGNTRIDLMAGLAQVTTLVSRLSTGTKKTAAGDIESIRGEVGYGKEDSSDVVARFLRTKLSPLPSTMLDVLSGQDVVGRPVTFTDVAKESLMPMTYGDIVDAIQEHGIAKGSAMGLLAMFGAGLQTYEPKKKKSAGTNKK